MGAEHGNNNIDFNQEVLSQNPEAKGLAKLIESSSGEDRDRLVRHLNNMYPDAIKQKAAAFNSSADRNMNQATAVDLGNYQAPSYGRREAIKTGGTQVDTAAMERNKQERLAKVTGLFDKIGSGGLAVNAMDKQNLVNAVNSLSISSPFEKVTVDFKTAQKLGIQQNIQGLAYGREVSVTAANLKAALEGRPAHAEAMKTASVDNRAAANNHMNNAKAWANR